MKAALAALFIFLALSPAPGAAQAPAAVAKPDVKAGDRWVYRRTDRRAKPPVYLYELQVSFVDSRAIHTVLARQGKARDSDATWTPEWNGVVSVDEGVIQLEQGLLRFPLAAGAEKSDWARNTVWYSPRAKRWVKSLYEDAQGIIGEELVFYVVQ